MGDLRFTIAVVYIDAILIPADDIEEGFRNLELILQALRKHSFTLNLAKCNFFQHKIDYLGREISAEGVRPGRCKVEAIKRAPYPTCVKEVRQFLGLAGYFRKFVSNFARKVAPLTDLLRKDAC